VKIKPYKIIIFAISLYLIVASGAHVTSAAIITVDDDGGSDYISIQAAVDNASHNDRIIVYPGTYTENVDVDKGLTIISKSGNPDDTVVQAADPDDHVFHVTANNVTIRGFSITGASKLRNAGIYLYGVSESIITNNKLSNNYHGIALEASSSNRVNNNTAILNKKNGIYLYGYSNNNILSNNTANSNCWIGIEQYKSSNNILINNTANSNWDGIILSFSSNSILINNVANANNDDGIDLSGATDNTLCNNTANSNTENGFLLGYSSNNTLINNTASNNKKGIYLFLSSDNTLKNNYLSNNLKGIYDWKCDNTICDNEIHDRVTWKTLVIDFLLTAIVVGIAFVFLRWIRK
jgi:parallel beta-helix repeat protein